VILHFELITFDKPEASMRTQLDGIPTNPFADANYQMAASEGNVSFCCNTTTTTNSNGTVSERKTLTGTFSDTDFALINGGYQPTIYMKSGEWQRWRLLHSGFKRFMDLQIFDAATENVNLTITNDCEMGLIAKDGVYLMEIPRPITNIFLSSASRAELLIRCHGAPGRRFTIQSGRQPPDVNFSFGSPPTLFLSHNQSIVATIEIEVAPAGSNGQSTSLPLTPGKKCTPLRPAYAADMRDEALAKENALDKIYYEYYPAFASIFAYFYLAGGVVTVAVPTLKLVLGSSPSPCCPSCSSLDIDCRLISAIAEALEGFACPRHR
jgi:FtsP/CotA-like multicopper oxidase with cupredoxin domain